MDRSDLKGSQETRPAREERGFSIGGENVRKKIVILVWLAIVLLCPSSALSDCAELKRSTSIYVAGSHSIIFYSGLMPIGRVEVPYCTVNPSSNVRLLESYVCDGDKILIDGLQCTIMSVYPGSTGIF